MKNKSVSNQILLVPTLACVVGLAMNARANDADALPVVVVQGQLYGNSAAEQAFNVDVLDASALAALPVSNLADALEWVSGLDVRQRGSGGTQVDLSIRGAAYEQTLILLDGVRMNDPQTGHHNFDLPVVLEDIARIEVVRGPGAGQYGPNGNGGVINLVTRKRVTEEDGRDAGLKLEAGSKRYARGALTLGKTSGNWSQFASIAQQESDSYIKEATLDYLTQQGNYRLVYDGASHSTVVGLGYVDKGFGTEGFYTPVGATAKENTIQRHIYVTESIDIHKDLGMDVTVNWRQHDDEFFYKTFAPSVHQTNAWQARLRVNVSDRLSIGVEHNQEDLDSNAIVGKRHEREFSSVFLFGQHDLGAVTLAGSLSHLTYDGGERFTLPVAGLTWQASDAVSVYMNAGKSARVPSLNDLYLNQPSNKGNPDVEAETTRSGEIGARLQGPVALKGALFSRRSDNVIDFTRIQSEVDAGSAFIARNIKEVRVKGFDLEVDALPMLGDTGVQQARLTYTRLIQDLSNQFPQARYSKAQFEHQAVLALAQEVMDGWVVSSLYKIEDRYNGDAYHLWDLGLKRQYRSGYWALTATNLRDTEYVDSGFIEAPGSGFRFEVAVDL